MKDRREGSWCATEDSTPSTPLKMGYPLTARPAWLPFGSRDGAVLDTKQQAAPKSTSALQPCSVQVLATGC